MVIGLLVVSAIPTTIGICQGLSAQKKANAAAKEKAKFHLTATVCLDENGPVECWCILKDSKVSPCIGPSFTGPQNLSQATGVMSWLLLATLLFKVSKMEGWGTGDGGA